MALAYLEFISQYNAATDPKAPIYMQLGKLTDLGSLKLAEWKVLSGIWEEHMAACERAYLRMIKHGATPEDAALVLPFSLKTEFYATATFEDWDHFLELRMDPHAGARIRVLANTVYQLLHREVPAYAEHLMLTEK
jgi:thymidylate synthase ThyX